MAKPLLPMIEIAEAIAAACDGLAVAAVEAICWANAGLSLAAWATAAVSPALADAMTEAGISAVIWAWEMLTARLAKSARRRVRIFMVVEF